MAENKRVSLGLWLFHPEISGVTTGRDRPCWCFFFSDVVVREVCLKNFRALILLIFVWSVFFF